MVLAVRRGSPVRRVAARFGVTHGTVQYWVTRTRGRRLDRVDFADRPRGRPRPVNRVSQRIEKRVLKLRRELKDRSALGECGAAAIARELAQCGVHSIPCVRTIGRILYRHGVLDARHRLRRPPPPKGWYLPEVAARKAEIDSFDLVTDLVIRGGQAVTVLNGISLHGGLPVSWPEARVTAKITVEKLISHWQRYGLPHFAKFDNDTIFQGAHQWADSFGRVIRLCLQLGVNPIFTPPREPGFQAEIESFNGRWQRMVWRRVTHPSLQALQGYSGRFIEALIERSASRISLAPERRVMPKDFRLDLSRPLAGSLTFIRRTNAEGRVQCLGHSWPISADWVHRLVRLDVDLSQGQVTSFALRRREPNEIRLLRSFRYQPLHKLFSE